MRYLTVSLYFFKYTVKAQLTDQRIQPTANFIMEHQTLLPKPEFSDRSSNLKQLNLSLKEYYGERFVLPCHLIHISFPWAIYNYLSRGTEDDS